MTLIAVRRICLSLIVAHVVTFTAAAVLSNTLLHSPELWWLARGAGFGIVWIAIASAVAGAAFLFVGIGWGIPSAWQWGGALLLINVLPYVLLLIAGDIAGLP